MAYHHTCRSTVGALLHPLLAWSLALTGAVVLPLAAITASAPAGGQQQDYGGVVSVTRDTTDAPAGTPLAPEPSPVPAPSLPPDRP